MISFPLPSSAQNIWTKHKWQFFSKPIDENSKVLPILVHLNQILSHLVDHPLNQTLTEENVEFFFEKLLPSVCTSIIKSQIRDSMMIHHMDEAIENLVAVFMKYFSSVGEKYPSFMGLLSVILSPHQPYYKFSSQIQQCLCQKPFCFGNIGNIYEHNYEIGELVDLVCSQPQTAKIGWTRGKIIGKKEGKFQIAYTDDSSQKSICLPSQCSLLAPYEINKEKYRWRWELEQGDKVYVLQQKEKKELLIAGVVKRILDDQIQVQFELFSNDEAKQLTNERKVKKTYHLLSQKLVEISWHFLFQYLPENKKLTSDEILKLLNHAEFSHLLIKHIITSPAIKSKLLYSIINKLGESKGFLQIFLYLEKNINFALFDSFSFILCSCKNFFHSIFLSKLQKKISIVLQKYENLQSITLLQLKTLYNCHNFCHLDTKKIDQISKITFNELSGSRNFFRTIHFIMEDTVKHDQNFLTQIRNFFFLQKDYFLEFWWLQSYFQKFSSQNLDEFSFIQKFYRKGKKLKNKFKKIVYRLIKAKIVKDSQMQPYLDMVGDTKLIFEDLSLLLAISKKDFFSKFQGKPIIAEILFKNIIQFYQMLIKQRYKNNIGLPFQKKSFENFKGFNSLESLKKLSENHEISEHLKSLVEAFMNKPETSYPVALKALMIVNEGLKIGCNQTEDFFSKLYEKIEQRQNEVCSEQSTVFYLKYFFHKSKIKNMGKNSYNFFELLFFYHHTQEQNIQILGGSFVHRKVSLNSINLMDYFNSIVFNVQNQEIASLALSTFFQIYSQGPKSQKEVLKFFNEIQMALTEEISQNQPNIKNINIYLYSLIQIIDDAEKYLLYYQNISLISQKKTQKHNDKFGSKRYFS